MSRPGADIRYACRYLRSNPAFTAVAVLSLALGIGVNTAVFSLVDQLLLWSVPVRDPARLVNLDGGRSRTYAFYREYRDRNQVFSGLLASSDVITAGLRPEAAPAVETGRVTYVSGNYFETLGVGAAAGRLIVNADDQKPGGSPVAVLSYAYWQRFAGAPSVIGRKLTINGYPFEIAGIAERGFYGIFNGQRSDVFVPITMYPITTPAAATMWQTPNMFWLNEVGRLKAGVSIEQAQAAMRVLWPQAIEAVNDSVAKGGGRRRTYKDEQITVASGARGAPSGIESLQDPLRVLSFATGFVLLMACANVANLLLARAGGRGREIAIRVAVGASRGRLVRQLLTESIMLASLGGCAGIAIAYWGVWSLAKINVVPQELRLQPSLRMLVFSLTVTIATGVLFGLVPALRVTRISVAESIKAGGPAGQGGSRFRLGKALIAFQVALSLALLAGAGLFIRSVRNLQNVDIGFQRENVLIVDVDPTTYGYSGHRLRTFYDQLIERVRSIPGVRAAALSGMAPMGEYARSRTFSAEGYQPRPGERLGGYSNRVSPGYFSTIGAPMLLGRDFRVEDGTGVCVINESLARRLFGDVNAIGRHLSFADRYSPEDAMEIVGVVKDVHYAGVKRADSMGVIYVPSWSDGAEARLLAVRTNGAATPVIAAIRREVRALDANVPMLRARKLEEYVNANLQRNRLVAYLSGFFGAVALGLAAIGLYGVVAHTVARRTREVGIRMALGARQLDVIRMIVSESLLPVSVGLIIGIGTAMAATRAIAGLLFGVAARDPLTIAAAVLAILIVALLTASIPARRASQIDPMLALRNE